MPPLPDVSVDVVLVEVLPPDVVEPFGPPDAGLLDEVPVEREALVEARRSTFAQPEPLNTIAGAESALRIVPSAPHSGQKRGPWSLIPWMTSVTRPQAPQL